MNGTVGSVGSTLKKTHAPAPENGVSEEDAEKLGILTEALKELPQEEGFSSWGAQALTREPGEEAPTMVLGDGDPVKQLAEAPKQKVATPTKKDSKAGRRTFLSAEEIEKRNFGADLSEEEEKEDPELQRKLEQLREIYTEESVMIAESWWNDISEILLSEDDHFTFEFGESMTKIKGLTFTLRSLNAGEDYNLKMLSRINGWDRNISNQTVMMTMHESLCVMLVDFCGKDLSEMTLDRRKKFVEKIEGFAQRAMIDCLENFQLAIDIISRGEEHLDLVKKSLARQRI